MKRICSTCFCWLLALVAFAVGNQQLDALVNRVGGEGASAHIVFRVKADGKPEQFTITQQGGKPCIQANTLSAASRGLGWYLNHYMHVNITWNHLTESLSGQAWPLPAKEETHTTDLAYRYYLNYCTFSYSMAAWDEDRWMKEIDWMALHGVNLPLQLVGIDAVWYQLLTQDFQFSHDEANQFIAGPMHQGWWLMNNLTRHGGPNPKWWYEREAALGKAIVARMLELGITPCLPGFVGMAPDKYVKDKAINAYGGSWCGFASPHLLNVTDAGGKQAFDQMAEKYYARIQSVFGFTPTAYSMDPVHERDLPEGMGKEGYKALCDAARAAMDKVKPGALWVAQEWQVNADQHRIDALPAENTLLLDLSSERLTYVERFGSHPYAFCMLHNYGGNIGMYGCIEQMLSNYRKHTSAHSRILRGVGATPEGIETNPVLYELLFELPWLAEVPQAQAWLGEYARCRYNVDSPAAKEAWARLLATVYNQNSQNQQGCREPVFCARPNLEGNGASSWSNAFYTWDKQEVIASARLLLSVGADNDNYRYDVVDVVRQALTDHAHTLQMQLKAQREAGETAAFQATKAKFLQLIEDIDKLLATTEDFRLGHWVGNARRIAAEAGHPEDADWLERNARMLVTSWGETSQQVDNGGLRDYGNREYQGLLTDYYKPRWEAYFANDCQPLPWLNDYELPFVNASVPAAPYGKYQPNAATGNPLEVAQSLFSTYFGK